MYGGGCSGTQYGCCSDAQTAKEDPEGSNCGGGGSFPIWEVVGGVIVVTIACCTAIYFQKQKFTRTKVRVETLEMVKLVMFCPKKHRCHFTR
jgi:hypothetical protein